MAEVKQEKTSQSSGSSLSKWFRGMKSELNKVVWPTWPQVLNNTVIVIAVSVALALVIGLIDYLAYQGILALLGAIG
ncbi:MAG: preprotein translocase subunit SecE [Oscillospiraceae bacterium]|nr:preprotein translocase subunit SecE [Oscillospiraceae bacterium]